MTILKTLAIAMLGSAALLPALPAWADAPKQDVAAADSAKPAASTPPLTVTAKPGAADTSARDAEIEKRRADRKAFMDARFAALKAGLQLTADQQPLWDPVESALRDLAKTRHQMRHAMHEAMRDGADKQDPAARLKQRGERLVAMGQAMGKLADASGPLLAALTPAQKERLPMLVHHIGPHRLVKQAFGIEGHHGWGHHGWGREGMRFGMHMDRDHMDRDREGWRHEGMRDGGEGGWRHRHFAERDDRDGDRGSDVHGRGFDRDRSDRDGDGWHGHHHGWDRDGHADRDERDGDRDGRRFDHDGGPSRHFQHDGHNTDDERIGG